MSCSQACSWVCATQHRHIPTCPDDEPGKLTSKGAPNSSLWCFAKGMETQVLVLLVNYLGLVTFFFGTLVISFIQIIWGIIIKPFAIFAFSFSQHIPSSTCFLFFFLPAKSFTSKLHQCHFISRVFTLIKGL